MLIFILICFCLVSFYSLLIIIYAIGWYKVKAFHFNKDYNPSTSVSIIIPARNESKNIGSCIKAILNNNYPSSLLEIIIIDDFSEDNTSDTAKNILSNYKNIIAYKVLNMRDYSDNKTTNSFKKKAIETGVQESAGQLIITTDADSISGPNWILSMVAFFEQKNANFIAAPVSFINAKDSKRKGLLYYFQSLDFMTMQGITTASAALKLGNMCNGANLGFRKEVFDKVEGYKGIDHIASGDDMLLMHKIYQLDSKKVHYLKSSEAIVKTSIQPSWKGFFNQRIRWSSKAGQYKEVKLTLILLLVYLFNLSILTLFIICIFKSYLWPVLWIVLFVKVYIELLFSISVAQFYGKVRELLIFPFLQPLHILYILAAGFLGKFGRYEWKGRKVK